MFEKTYYGLVMLSEVSRVQGYPNSTSFSAALREIFVQLIQVVVVDNLFVKNLELLLLEANYYCVLVSPIGLVEAVAQTLQLWAIEILQVVHFL
jgi:hypothetical protein